MRVLLVALIISGCAASLPTEPAEQARLIELVQEIAGVDPDEISPGKRAEMARACNGLEVADLLGYLPKDVTWRVWCDQVWGRTK
jgi:hypothetical protein